MAATRQPKTRSVRLGLEGLEDRATPVAGFLDPNFGANGLSITAFSQGGAGGAPQGNDVAVQADGKIVVVGSAASPLTNGGSDMAVARLNPDGSPDITFGNGGQVLVPFDLGGAGNNSDVANAVFIQSNGKIVIGGSANLTFGTDESALARLNADGSLDTTFGTGGKFVYTPFLFVGSPEDSQINSLVVQPDGKIVTAGDSTFNPFAITRVNPNGTLDTTFGTGGVTTVNVLGTSFFQHAEAVALQADGKIVVVGTVDPGALGQEMGATRLNTNGTVDTTFGTLGRFIAGFYTGAGTGGTGRDVLIDSAGRIYIAGSKIVANDRDFAVVRLNSGGTFDASYGTGGVATVPFNLGPGSVSDEASGLGLQADGKIVLGGTASTGVFSTGKYAAARFLPNGQLDTTFGTGGKNTYDVGTTSPLAANALAFQTNGEVLIAGTAPGGMAIIELQNDSTGGGGGGGGGGAPGGGAGVNSVLAVGAAPGQVFGYTFNTSTGLYDTQDVVNPSNILAGLFPGFTGTYRVAMGDVNGDTIPDFIVGTGPQAGFPSRFAVVSGDLKSVLIAPTVPFRGSPNFDGGVFVSAGDLNFDARADVVVTPDFGGGPRVVVYSLGATGPGFLADFLGISDPNFRGGARSAVGDVNGDGFPDLAIAAGPGGGPRIALYDGSSVLSGTPTKLVGDFFAFDTTLRDGAYVAIGDVNGDGFGDMVFGAGPGGAPRVLVASGARIMSNGGASAVFNPLATWFVGGDSTSRSGVPVVVKNLDNDTKADIIVGSGLGQESRARVYLGNTIPTRGEPPAFQDIDPFNTVLTDGMFVG